MAKRTGRRLAAVVVVLAVMGAAAAWAGGTPALACEGALDLVSGQHTLAGLNGVEVLEGPANGQVVVKISFDPRTTEYRRAVFEIGYSAVPKDFTVNIGDSRTNNGYAGDAGTQSNDAEAQVLNSRLYLYGRDGTPPQAEGGALLLLVKDAVTGPGTLRLEVADGYLGWRTTEGRPGALRSPWAFALKGQPDQEGPVNYDLFVAFDRVVSDAGRSGTGVAKVLVSLYFDEPAGAPAGPGEAGWMGMPTAAPKAPAPVEVQGEAGQ